MQDACANYCQAAMANEATMANKQDREYRENRLPPGLLRSRPPSSRRHEPAPGFERQALVATEGQRRLHGASRRQSEQQAADPCDELGLEPQEYHRMQTDQHPKPTSQATKSKRSSAVHSRVGATPAHTLVQNRRRTVRRCQNKVRAEIKHTIEGCMTLRARLEDARRSMAISPGCWGP